MMYRLDIFDETMFQIPTFAMSLDITQSTTARQIIKERILKDCQTHNIAQAELLASQKAQMLAEYQKRQGNLTEKERLLNGDKTPKFPHFSPTTTELDWQVEFGKAVKAFANNGFMLFIDDRQITDLDEPIMLREHDPSTVTFIKLIALQGG